MLLGKFLLYPYAPSSYFWEFGIILHFSFYLLIILDYIKRLIYQILNENEELKVKQEKEIIVVPKGIFEVYEEQEVMR